MIYIQIEKITNGIILIGIGMLFLLSNLGIIQWSIFGVFFKLWPVILIVVGINLIFKNNHIMVIATWLLFFFIFIIYGFLFQERYEINTNHIIIENFQVIKNNK